MPETPPRSPPDEQESRRAELLQQKSPYAHAGAGRPRPSKPAITLPTQPFDWHDVDKP
jgi:hypothetical protein